MADLDAGATGTMSSAPLPDLIRPVLEHYRAGRCEDAKAQYAHPPAHQLREPAMRAEGCQVGNDGRRCDQERCGPPSAGAAAPGDLGRPARNRTRTRAVGAPVGKIDHDHTTALAVFSRLKRDLTADALRAKCAGCRLVGTLPPICGTRSPAPHLFHERSMSANGRQPARSRADAHPPRSAASPRWVHEHLIEDVQRRLDANPDAMHAARDGRHPSARSIPAWAHPLPRPSAIRNAFDTTKTHCGLDHAVGARRIRWNAVRGRKANSARCMGRASPIQIRTAPPSCGRTRPSACPSVSRCRRRRSIRGRDETLEGTAQRAIAPFAGRLEQGLSPVGLLGFPC